MPVGKTTERRHLDMTKKRIDNMNKIGLFYWRRIRNKYDIIINRQNIFRDLILFMLALIGLDINALSCLPSPHLETWVLIYILTAINLFFLDIIMPTVFHNAGVFENRKKQKLAKETKAKA